MVDPAQKKPKNLTTSSTVLVLSCHLGPQYPHKKLPLPDLTRHFYRRCLVLVDFRNGFARDFIIEFKQMEEELTDVKIINYLFSTQCSINCVMSSKWFKQVQYKQQNRLSTHARTHAHKHTRTHMHTHVISHSTCQLNKGTHR